MKPIRVVVLGASGRMGQEVINALCGDPDVEAVGAVELEVTEDYLTLPDASGKVPLSSDLEYIFTECKPEVLVDFTIAQATMPAVRIAAKHGVNLVIGTTGLTPDDISEIDNITKTQQVGTVVAPNFALGAVLMMHLAQIAGRHFDYAEIIESHHHQKVDAPSGTALSTAKAMAQARGKPFSCPSGLKTDLSSRGKQVEGIALHSVRLPGLMAHQEVILGTTGQTLTIRHDTINRQCFMPGVILAIKEVTKHQGLVYGLDTLMGLRRNDE